METAHAIEEANVTLTQKAKGCALRIAVRGSP